MSWLGTEIRRIDRMLAEFSGRRRVLVDARTAMNFAILAPIFERLQLDPRVEVLFAADRPADVAGAAKAAGVRSRIHARPAIEWRRIDLCLSADPWDPIRLRRCRRRANFFHGIAGKYDLDSPGGLPIGFDEYDRVAFINSDRMRRYLDAGIVAQHAAVLVGYPKVDALANGRYDAAAIHARLQLEMHRRTAIYAPTWSPASSLNVAGEDIVKSLVDAGFNVIVKLHDRSLDPTEPRFSGGIDWRARFARTHVPGRIAFVEWADSSPLLAASDVMVTDHSSVGFEFCLLDRPLVIFDAPDLARVARINPEKIALLRSAARVVRTAGEVGPAALEEMGQPEHLGDARRAIAREMFHEPGTATERALAMVYDLLDLPAPHHRELSTHRESSLFRPTELQMDADGRRS
jgi:CDP-glycerol:poly(glycerophosphate) glycerophosphotransferase